MTKNASDIDRFTFCLRVSHPRLTADEIEKCVGQRAQHKVTLGEVRFTSNGTPIHGARPAAESHCVFQDVGGVPTEFANALHNAAAQLSERKASLRELLSNGGEANFLVGYFLGPNDMNSGFDIEPETLLLLAELGLRLSVCLYRWPG